MIWYRNNTEDKHERVYSERYLERRNKSRGEDKNIIIVMSKNKKSAECQTQFQSSENIYNFQTNNEDDPMTYHINSRSFNSSESRV